MKPIVTSFDVARHAGVSRATVSLVLNRSSKASISAETREKVLCAAKELCYRPNSAGRMLVSGHSETIALVLSDSEILLSDAFIPHILHGIGIVNRKFGYHLLVDGVRERGKQTTYRRLAEARRIDGMIVLNPRSDDAELPQLIDEGFPIVLIGSLRHAQEYSVSFSTREGIGAAVRHLVGLGHAKFGMIPFSQPGLIATDVRVAVLKSELKQHGLPLDDDAVEHADFSSLSGYEATQRLFARRPDLTAILAGNDTIAVGAMSALQAMGARIPQDVSVVGFDDLPFAPFLAPPLTTVRTDGVDLGSKAANLLIHRLRGEPIDDRRVHSSTQFVIRGSTGTCNGSQSSGAWLANINSPAQDHCNWDFGVGSD